MLTMPARDLEVEVWDDPQSLRALEDPWGKLARRAGAGYFQTWQWVAAWSGTIEPECRLIFVLVKDRSGLLRGLLPLATLERRLHRKVPFALPYLGLAGSGAGAGDHLGPVADSPEAFERLAVALTGLAAGRTVLLENLDAPLVSELRSSLRASVIEEIRCPFIDLAALSRVEDAWSKKQRENIRRRERQLSELGFRGRWIGPGPVLADALVVLRDLHQHRWTSLGREGLFDSRRLSFLRRLAELGEPPDGPWLYLLERDGEAGAGLLGFRYGPTFSSYKTGWDPAFAKYGIGIALTAAAMRSAHAEGLVAFDLLRGAEPHKYALGASDRLDSTLLRWRGVRGAALLARETASRKRAPASSGRNAPIPNGPGARLEER